MLTKYQKALSKQYKWMKRKGKRTAYDMFGIECGDGWYSLIDELCFNIDRVLTGNPKLRFCVTQIKEKFGGLRFYYYGGDDEITKLVSNAEDKSFKICEDCGKKGKKVEVRGWLRTQCKKCADEWRKQK